MLHVIEMKLYLAAAQEDTLNQWLGRCCWLYNRCLEQRIKAHQRRGEFISYNAQSTLLTGLRERMPLLAEVPVQFARDALHRIDRGFQAFFRRCKVGVKPGFPRFRSHTRYNSLECLAAGSYVRSGNLLCIPKLGLVKFRAGDQRIHGQQKLLRIIRRASGWFGQVLVDDGESAPAKVPVYSAVGIDMGLESFATLSNGVKIDNPRFFRKAERKIKRTQRRLAKCQRHSRNRRKVAQRVARAHECVTAQRKNFAHQHARRLVNRFDLIGFEDLNVKGLARTRLAKSIHDAAWSMFIRFVACKAESAGKYAILLDPRGTSQECPSCGTVRAKSLSERTHACSCGLRIDRDEAAARVILARALGVVGAAACGGIDHYVGLSTGASRSGEAGSPHDVTHR